MKSFLTKILTWIQSWIDGGARPAYPPPPSIRTRMDLLLEVPPGTMPIPVSEWMPMRIQVVRGGTSCLGMGMVRAVLSGEATPTPPLDLLLELLT